MTLLYKPDWEETKERYRTWWRGEYFGRCAMSVTAPLANPPKIALPPRPSDPIERWTDLEYLGALNEHRNASTFFGGEAFPGWHGGYPGHTAIPAFLGCPITLDMVTGWWDPVLLEPEWDATSLSIDPANRWWRFTLSLLRHAKAQSAGRAIPSIGAFGGCGDTLAALRGTDRLLLDCMDCPERVRAAELYLMAMWCDVYRTFQETVYDEGDGTTCWFALWAPGRFYAGHCDFAYMISPKTFQDLFLPAIEQQAQFLDYVVYHLDGEGNFGHLPLLLDLPRIQAIQVLPGAGKPSPQHYLDVLKEVQAAGRNLHISIPADEVERALDLLSARGLFIDTTCRTEQEARDLLKCAERWSHP